MCLSKVYSCQHLRIYPLYTHHNITYFNWNTHSVIPLDATYIDDITDIYTRYRFRIPREVVLLSLPILPRQKQNPSIWLNSKLSTESRKSFIMQLPPVSYEIRRFSKPVMSWPKSQVHIFAWGFSERSNARFFKSIHYSLHTLIVHKH